MALSLLPATVTVSPALFHHFVANPWAARRRAQQLLALRKRYAGLERRAAAKFKRSSAYQPNFKAG